MSRQYLPVVLRLYPLNTLIIPDLLADRIYGRPKARTNYGTQTFKFISSQIWESINPEIKRSNSMSIFKIRYTQFLIMSQTHSF